MDFSEYTWFVSTYKPIELGITEETLLNYFANNKSASVYQVHKEMYGDEYHSMAYKNVHKRVIRLFNLNLITKVEDHYKRGAIHYKLSPYGLIQYLSNTVTESSAVIRYNIDNPVIQFLLLQIFEEETIKSFSLKNDQAIMQYLNDCCNITRNTCKTIWNKVIHFKIGEIFPRDYALQKYFSFLHGKPVVDESVWDEIKVYQFNIKKIITEEKTPNSYKELKKSPSFQIFEKNYLKNDSDPFFLKEIYYYLLENLSYPLEEKAKSLALNIISELGESVLQYNLDNKEKLENKYLHFMYSEASYKMLNDKRFFNVVSEIKKDFDAGYKQFLHY